MSYSVPTVGNLVGVIHCAMAIRGSRSALLSALNILCVEVKEKSKCSVVVGITAICLFANIGMGATIYSLPLMLLLLVARTRICTTCVQNTYMEGWLVMFSPNIIFALFILFYG